MRAPFPGMDPYLEHPALWPGFHSGLMNWMSHQLSPLLRPRYIVTVEDRVFIDRSEQVRIPDLWIQKARENGGPGPARPAAQASPVIVEVETLPEEELEVHEHYMEILDRYRDMKVVTTIEVLSPTNKAAGEGRTAYLAKPRQVRSSESHLVEIDLLRTGQHTVNVPAVELQKYAPFNYLICTTRYPERRRFEVYSFELRERIPDVAVPLEEGDPHVILDIQSALEQVYEDRSYMLRVRYDEPCDPPLAPAAQEWAHERWRAYKAAHPELFAQK
jgi:hypothetical protein